MHRSTLSPFSYVCLLAAAAASMATSAPAPDWVIEDTASGEVTLSPDVDETLIHLRVSSQLVSSTLSMEIAVDPPPPAPPTVDDAAQTPILLFVGVPTVATEGTPIPATRLTAFPGAYGRGADGFESTSSAGVPIDANQNLDVRITWKSEAKDRMVTATERHGDTTFSGPVERPVAPRRLVKIRWRARLHVDGYGDRPAGTVDVEPAS